MMAGEKKKIYKKDVVSLKIPKNPELSIKKMWPIAMKIPNWMKYMPDEWAGGDEVDRAYFWAVFCYLDLELAEKLVSDFSQ
jgi:hypothetical protein